MSLAVCPAATRRDAFFVHIEDQVLVLTWGRGICFMSLKTAAMRSTAGRVLKPSHSAARLAGMDTSYDVLFFPFPSVKSGRGFL